MDLKDYKALAASRIDSMSERTWNGHGVIGVHIEPIYSKKVGETEAVDENPWYEELDELHEGEEERLDEGTKRMLNGMSNLEVTIDRATSIVNEGELSPDEAVSLMHGMAAIAGVMTRMYESIRSRR